CPVLDVTDNRRLTLWLSFGLTMLGGIGLDRLGGTRRLGMVWIMLWVAGGAALLATACGIRTLEPAIRARAVAHYRHAAETGGTTGEGARVRAERQVRATLDFIPRYYGLSAAGLLMLTALALLARKPGRPAGWMRPALLGLTLAELGLFGFG